MLTTPLSTLKHMRFSGGVVYADEATKAPIRSILLLRHGNGVAKQPFSTPSAMANYLSSIVRIGAGLDSVLYLPSPYSKTL
jgi:hypothetical protein